MNRVASAAAAALLLSACATPYEPQTGLTKFVLGGGVTAQRIDGSTAIVTASGNSSTSRDRIQVYVLRKAAEETVAAGHEWFVITSAQDRTRQSTFTSPTQSYTNAQVTAYGNTATGSAQTTTYGGGTTTVYAPGLSVVVKMGSGPKPIEALNAAEVVQNTAFVLAKQ